MNATRGDQELEFSVVKQVNVHLLADQAVFQNEIDDLRTERDLLAAERDSTNAKLVASQRSRDGLHAMHANLQREHAARIKDDAVVASSPDSLMQELASTKVDNSTWYITKQC